MDEIKIPRQGLLDYLTRIDELLIANIKAIQGLEAATNIILPPARRLPLAEMKRRLESGQEVPYEVKALDMAGARTDEEIVVEGDYLTVQTNGSLAGVTIKFNMPTASAVPMEFFNPWKQQFFKLYLSHTAQAGKTLYLAIGREASMEALSYVIMTELKNKVSAVIDSTVATLGIAGTYTGTAFSVEEYGRIIGSCLSDQDGTLYVDQRNDGTNWDSRETMTYVANDPMGFSVEVLGNEARVVFTNGAVAQTAFRLYTRLRRL